MKKASCLSWLSSAILVEPDRLSVWPLSTGELRLLRILSPWLNPVTWLVVALVIWKHASIGFCAVVIGTFVIGFVLPSVPAASNGVWRRMPNFPSPLNHLIRKNLRELLSTLDFWCSVLVSAMSLGFRAAGLLPREAFLPLTMLVMLSLSTYARTLFGLDGAGGMTRYQLLPVPAWHILAAKDVPFLLVSVLVTLPLAPAAGLAAALSALSMGHHASVIHYSPQVRWRFSSGVSFSTSIFEVVIMCAAAAAVYSIPLLMLLCLGAYAGSSLWYGRVMEEHSRQ